MVPADPSVSERPVSFRRMTDAQKAPRLPDRVAAVASPLVRWFQSAGWSVACTHRADRPPAPVADEPSHSCSSRLSHRSVTGTWIERWGT